MIINLKITLRLAATRRFTTDESFFLFKVHLFVRAKHVLH